MEDSLEVVHIATFMLNLVQNTQMINSTVVLTPAIKVVNGFDRQDRE